MKLWDKGKETNELVNSFTVGKDRAFDLHLAPFDILGTMAHIMMLKEVNLLNNNEWGILHNALNALYKKIQNNDFYIDERVEDIHSQIELSLTQEIGDIGKKIHSGRSRNDQVLLDIKLFLRDEIFQIRKLIECLFNQLIILSERYKEILIPGYTHLQVAMPSSFGLWFGAYAESFTDDLELLKCSFNQVNQNPLGSAAGYGSSFPLNRKLTTQLLGFKDLNYNVVYAQMNRGKTEQTLAFAISGIASTLSKMAMDMCLYNSQNFNFVSFPDDFTTGSSIMPHKKNPDVWELVRGKCNRIKACPNEISLLISNLPSGYHRDLQLTKEVLFPKIFDLKECLEVSLLMIQNIKINAQIIKDERYKYLFSVEEVNKTVLSGVPFRDAYKLVGKKIENNEYIPDYNIKHTHEGSIGNLCNDYIITKFNKTFNEFDTEKVKTAYEKLLKKVS